MPASSTRHEKGMVEALAVSHGLFALRRIAIAEPLDDFFFDPVLSQPDRLSRATAQQRSS